MTFPQTRPTLGFVLTAGLLAFGLTPLPGGWARSARQSFRAPEMSRADRDAAAGGYYEDLIGRAGGNDSARNEMTLRLMGKPADWVKFSDIGACRDRPDDLLQFELKPNVRKTLFGRPFTTNAEGLRDRETPREKPPGTLRIALLGSSIDMGWGVGTDETYENMLEDWLNRHAVQRGIARRFEILNFGVAAYSPLHRLESFERKAAAFAPDLVIYSATLLDNRLLQIHLCNLLQGRFALGHDFLRDAIADAGITTADLELDDARQLVHKDTVKDKLKPRLWPLTDSILGELAESCRSRQIPLVCVIIPRVTEADAHTARSVAVARQAAIASRHGIPLIDLTATFDTRDPAHLEIAAWDDHPNALGHKLLFYALARALAADPALYAALFHPANGAETTASPASPSPKQGFSPP